MSTTAANAPLYRSVYTVMHGPLTLGGIERRQFFVAVEIGAAAVTATDAAPTFNSSRRLGLNFSVRFIPSSPVQRARSFAPWLSDRRVLSRALWRARFLPMRIGDVGGDCTLVGRANRDRRALRDVDDLAGAGRDSTSVATNHLDSMAIRSLNA
jgi:hypothetical protein